MGEHFYRVHIESREFSGLIGSTGRTLSKGHAGLGGHGTNMDRLFDEFSSEFFKNSKGDKMFDAFKESADDLQGNNGNVYYVYKRINV